MAADVVLDSGLLIGIERGRGDRMFASLIEALRRASVQAMVPAPVLAEVWTGKPSQALLHRALRNMEVIGCDEALAKRAGVLRVAADGTAMDAIVVATGEVYQCKVLTGDPGDLRALAAHAVGVEIESIS
jgi:predicted nucleic acid-binding protein